MDQRTREPALAGRGGLVALKCNEAPSIGPPTLEGFVFVEPNYCCVFPNRYRALSPQVNILTAPVKAVPQEVPT
jgi:hypothetical protein